MSAGGHAQRQTRRNGAKGATNIDRRYRGTKQERYGYALHRWGTLSEYEFEDEAYDSKTQHKRLPNPNFREGQLRPAPLKLTDIEALRTLGRGAYGTVLSARVRKRLQPHSLDVEGGVLAVKVMPKSYFRENEPDIFADKMDPTYEDSLNWERTALSTLGWHPFICNSISFEADSRNLYMLSELAAGGMLLHRLSKSLDTHTCRFYFANIVSALEFIHHNGFVHCDLKPNNIFLRGDGYLMIGDFGLATRHYSQRDWDHVGTTEYMPVECIEGKVDREYTRAIDWWSAACILYEMATGRMAFRRPPRRPGQTDVSNNIELDNIIREVKLEWPLGFDVDSDLKDLVGAMMHKDRHLRLGTMCPIRDHREKENKQVRGHKFMRGFQWERLERRELLAPYVLPRAPPDSESHMVHSHSLPAQFRIPGLPRVKPPPHLAFDRSLQAPKVASPKPQTAKRQREDAIPADGGENLEESPRKRRKEAGVMRRPCPDKESDADDDAEADGSHPPRPAKRKRAEENGSPAKKRKSVHVAEADSSSDEQARRAAFRARRKTDEINELKKAKDLLAKLSPEVNEDGEGDVQASNPTHQGSHPLPEAPPLLRPPIFVPPPHPAFETLPQGSSTSQSLWRLPASSQNAVAGPSRVSQHPRNPSPMKQRVFESPPSSDDETPKRYQPPSNLLGPSGFRGQRFEALPQEPHAHDTIWRTSLPETLQEHVKANTLAPLQNTSHALPLSLPSFASFTRQSSTSTAAESQVTPRARSSGHPPAGR